MTGQEIESAFVLHSRRGTTLSAATAAQAALGVSLFGSSFKDAALKGKAVHA